LKYGGMFRIDSGHGRFSSIPLTIVFQILDQVPGSGYCNSNLCCF